MENQKPPFSILHCNQTTRNAIEDYRVAIIQAVKKIKNGRRDVGLWAPACAQHGFTDTDSFTDTNFRVPSGSGPMVYEAIQEFLDNPEEAPWYIDEQPWPSNSGCSGLSSKHLQVE